jgi:hypothetical protein
VGIFETYFRSKGIKNPETSAKALAAVMHGIFLSYAYTGERDHVDLLRNTVIKFLIEKGV